MISPQLFGKYILIDKVAVGGMAEIYKAKALGLGGFEKTLAIKKILPHFAENDEFVTMFIDEAKIAGQLNHANIVQIFDLGEINGDYFIAMEYVYGRDLRASLRMAEKKGKPFSIEQAVYIIIETLKALDFAHRKKDSKNRALNIIHRDISPQNILISFEGEVKLTDFGIAKATSKASQTQAGVLKGKFAYMSPEQASGKRLDQRSDLFSVGILLYELLTGTRLFLAKTDFATLELVREAKVERPSKFNKKIPNALDRIVLKALKKKPEQRYQHALDFQEDLTRFLYSSSTFSLDKLNLAAYMQELFAETIQEDQERLKEENRVVTEFLRQIEAERRQQAIELSSNPQTPAPQSWEGLPTPSATGEEHEEDSEAAYSPEAPPRPSFLRQMTTAFLLSLLITSLFFLGQKGYEYLNRTASLSIDTDPTGAQVFLNKQRKGRTPLYNLQIPTRMHHLIHLQKDGYETQHFKLALKKRMKIEKTIHLSRTPEHGSAEIDSEPPGAEIFLDGKLQPEKTPARLDRLVAGRRYAIQIRYPGYLPFHETIEVGKGEKKRIRAHLQSAPPRREKALARSVASPAAPPKRGKPHQAFGRINIQANPWAQVFIDDEKIGNTPITDHRLAVGPHTIRLYHPIFKKERVFQVAIREGKNEEITWDFVRSK
ncbi:MAG: PEGA domain-containing protein [Deltaproteobacteria bacterium]|nr:MAG: PEGA domain-containing protein [Deltaproteobacteria bacterium]